MSLFWNIAKQTEREVIFQWNLELKHANKASFHKKTILQNYHLKMLVKNQLHSFVCLFEENMPKILSYNYELEADFMRDNVEMFYSGSLRNSQR